MKPGIGLVFVWFAAFTLPACHSTPRGSSAAVPQRSAVVSAHKLATEAGVEMLKKGGNAFDAAVAVAASLGVVEPFSAGVGGGGFWLLYSANDERYIFVDARETAPSSATRDQFLNEEGSRSRDLAINSGLSVGIPGQVRAFEHIVGRYGNLSLSDVLQPAIRQASNGFSIGKHYIQKLRYRIEHLRTLSASSHFLDSGHMPSPGFKVVQVDLANTLRAVAEKGSDAFYEGLVAEQLIEAVNQHGGAWSRRDLAGYEIVEREPLRGRFAGGRVITAPPPSAGGVALLQMMGVLDYHDWTSMDEKLLAHVTIESMRRAYQARAEYVGDPDFVSVPVDLLTADRAIKQLALSVDFEQATPSAAGVRLQSEKTDTTHLAVIDQYGNRVAATLSINLSFGSGIVAEGTGVLLNNELDDFSSGNGVPNAYGLVGSEPNRIQPGKRPVSSMTPTFIEWEGRVALIGTPGGSRIITMVLLAAMEAARDEPVSRWVGRSRFHHQYLPDVVRYESTAFSDQQIDWLKSRGHRLWVTENSYGNLHAIEWDRVKGVTAAADPRGGGEAWVGSVLYAQ